MTTVATPSLREAFTGRRGRLLAGLLLAEFAGAVQTIAYSSVLPLAARELHGSALYGATLASGSLVTILVLAGGIAMRDLRRMLVLATATYVLGVVLEATAPAMALVLAGSIVRGVAAGLLAGLGASAIGGLFDGPLRQRVLGLYALIWLLPSLAGAPVNGVIASAFGWRWAIAWPALAVVTARLLIGRQLDLVPWTKPQRRVDPRPGLVLVAAVALTFAAPALHNRWGIVPLAAGVAVAVVAALRTLRSMLEAVPDRMPGLLVFSGLILAFFGAEGLVPLGVLDGLGRGALASSVALGAGLVAWSVVGVRPPQRHGRPLIGSAVVAVAVGLLTLALTQAVRLDPVLALGLTVAGWTLAGCAMGAAYGPLYSAPFDDLDTVLVTTVGTATVFAELAASTVGTALSGGSYSVLTAGGDTPRSAIAAGYAVLVALLVAASARQLGGANRARSAGMSSGTSG